jgi:hypothetical protein
MSANKGSGYHGFVFERQQKFAGFLPEPLVRKPIWFADTMTFAPLENYDEQSRDLSRGRGKCAFRDYRVCCTAFRRSIRRTGEQHSKRSHGLR